MATYIKCPTCGRLLADKEIIFEQKIKKINEQYKFKYVEKEKKIIDLMNELKIPVNNSCCKMRLITSIDLFNIIK